MASGTLLVFDPLKTATAGAQAPPLSGGGIIPASPNAYYSAATSIENISYLADSIFFTGNIVGNLIIQVDNSRPETDIAGTGSRWQVYDKVNGGGFVNGIAPIVAGIISGGTNPGGYEFQRPTGFRRIRLLLSTASGSGTIEVLRTVKGGW